MDATLDIHHVSGLFLFYHMKNSAKLGFIVRHIELEIIIHVFVPSRLDYCNTL